MKLTINPYVGVAILLGFLMLAFLLFKGCNTNQSMIAENAELKAQISTLVKRRLADSLQELKNLEIYNDSLAYANAIIDLRDNQLEKSKSDLLVANNRINDLLKRYTPVEPDPDTTATFVPNEYIDDCADCFENLEDQQRRFVLYDKKVDSLKSAYISKEQLQNNRIVQLTAENKQTSLTLNDSLAAAKRQIQTLEPRGKMLLSLSALWANEILPKGVGGGLIYQDKHNRQYGVTVYGTNFGRLTTAELNLPLSFKKRR